MSYILDALKKSEQEHKKGQVPGLGTVQGLPGPGGRFETDRLIWMYGLVTILVAALALGTWLFLRESAPAPEKAPAPVAAQLPAEITDPAPAAIKTPPTRTELKPTSTPPPLETASKPAPRFPTGGIGSPELLKTVAPAPAAPLSTPEPARMIEEPGPSAEQVDEPSPAPSFTEEALQETPGVESNPELLLPVPIEQLPVEIRAEMPEVKIGVHLYSDTPASRRASINGRLIREGQTVEKDLILVAITRQGAVLSFRGRKFTVPVFPR